MTLFKVVLFGMEHNSNLLHNYIYKLIRICCSKTDIYLDNSKIILSFYMGKY